MGDSPKNNKTNALSLPSPPTTIPVLPKTNPQIFPLEASWYGKQKELGGEWGEALRSTSNASAHREYIKALKENEEFKQLTKQKQTDVLDAAHETIKSVKIKNGFTPEKSYLRVIEHSPIVSIDLIIFDHKGDVLLGKRQNNPAKNTWFVPGARLRKNEAMHVAIERIVDEELNIFLDGSKFNLIGAFNHVYGNNFCHDKFGTHYICFAYTISLDEPIHLSPDAQHEELKWWQVEDAVKDPTVHNYTKNYFHPAPWNKIK